MRHCPRFVGRPQMGHRRSFFLFLSAMVHPIRFFGLQVVQTALDDIKPRSFQRLHDVIPE